MTIPPQQQPTQSAASQQQQQAPQNAATQQSSQQQNDHDKGISETKEPGTADVLIFLEDGSEMRITFTLPKEGITLQEVFAQNNVPYSDEQLVQVVQRTGGSGIDYFVSIGYVTGLEKMLEKHPLFIGSVPVPDKPVDKKKSVPVVNVEMKMMTFPFYLCDRLCPRFRAFQRR